MMMAPNNMLDRATEAEAHAAKLSIKAAKDADDVVSIWFRDCERFEGEHRVMLQTAYTRMLRKFGALQP